MPSIKLFAKIGFIVVNVVEVFQEVEMRFRVDEPSVWMMGERIAWPLE